MLSNMGAFFNSMDYLYRPVSYTPSRTEVDSDGKVRLILCHERSRLSQLARHAGLRARQSDLSQPHERSADTHRYARLVKRSGLAEALPGDVARTSQEERLAQMRARFDGIRSRYNL